MDPIQIIPQVCLYISWDVKSQSGYMQWLIPFHVMTRERSTVHGNFDLVFGHSW
jgi:hypothetical protein